MVALSGNPSPIAANNNSSIIDPTTDAPTPPQTCNHNCAVLILAITIPLLSLLPICIFVLTLLYRRRQKKKRQSTEQESEIATRKLGPESETSSVAESFGGFHAVTNLEDSAAEESGRRSGAWKSASKTPGWWRMSFSSNQK